MITIIEKCTVLYQERQHTYGSTGSLAGGTGKHTAPILSQHANDKHKIEVFRR
jgi:hypothetical protein